MKLLSFSASRKESWGAVAGDGVIDHRKALEEKYAGLQDFIASLDYAMRQCG